MGCESVHSVFLMEPVPHYDRTQVATLTGAPAKVSRKQQGTIKPYGSVKFYARATDVPRPYTTIAILIVKGDPGDEAHFITAFLYRAADLNADAVIMDRNDAAVYGKTDGGGAIIGPNGGFGWGSSTHEDMVLEEKQFNFTPNPPPTHQQNEQHRKLMKQAARMQQQMEQVQAQLAARTVEATSGGGAVKVVAKCDGNIASIKIDPQALNPSDAQLLEDMIVTAANQALGQAREISNAEWAKSRRD